MNILKNIAESIDATNKKIINEDPYKDIQHLNRHIKHKNEIDLKLTDDEFNIYGDYLYTAPVDNKNILGFISCNEGVWGIAKYDVRNRLFIVYFFDENNKPFTRTTMRFGRDRYEKEKQKYYAGEVPKGM